jgi:hypothetical protein
MMMLTPWGQGLQTTELLLNEAVRCLCGRDSAATRTRLVGDYL